MHSIKILPGSLKPGDEVAIISPSFYIEREKIDTAVHLLKQWGLLVRVGRNTLKRSGPFAGTDDERLSDLQEMTNDTSVKAVLCSRGGYGISRIIDKVDFTALKKHPKWYVGFSDITVLHIWLSELCGIMSVHGEMPLNFGNYETDSYPIISLKQSLFGSLKQHLWQGPVFNTGSAEGEITGGNLSLLCSMIGTAAEPDTTDKILFIEEVGEYHFQIDRMLTSLKLAGKLMGLSALVVGGMSNLEEAKTPWGLTIEETIIAKVGEYGYPVFFNFPAGHIDDNRSFYIGRRAVVEADGDNCRLTYK